MIRHFDSLRVRLTAWYASVLVGVLATFGVLLYSVVAYQLVRHHDEALKAAAGEVARVLSQQEDCEHLTDAQRAELDKIGHLILFHDVGGEGRVFYRSSDSAHGEIPVDLQQVAATPASGWFETLPSRTGPMRVYSESYRSHAGRAGVIHVMHALGDVPAPLRSLRLALLLMTPLAVLLSSAAGYWLSGRALRPVDEVSRLAREIGASSLSRRLPVPKSHDEIGHLVETLNDMIARLESSFEGMKRFTADASHELRGPLATMRGAIDVALSREREPAEYRRTLASVGDDVNRLRSITEDLLVLARADAGRIVLEQAPVRLDVVTSEVVESFQPLATERKVSVSARCAEATTVSGDERWLRQLTFNVVDNAIKFAATAATDDAERSVTVEVAQEDDAAILRVSDTGPGISEEAAPRIFERFYRGDGVRTARGSEGVGLGLAIAAWIVDAHRGRISVAERPGGGAVFTVRLPLA